MNQETHNDPQEKNPNDLFQHVTSSSDDNTEQISSGGGGGGGGSSGGGGNRSYECHFCKRGFSNAQALGGHMNIHRKDKAKLKQLLPTTSITSNKQLMIISKEGEDDVTSKTSHDPHLQWERSKKVDETITRRVREIQQLPLFLDKPLADQRVHNQSDDNNQLDLELRLGPEPRHQDSSGATGTRKFF